MVALVCGHGLLQVAAIIAIDFAAGKAGAIE
jgi:hypothetical protein